MVITNESEYRDALGEMKYLHSQDPKPSNEALMKVIKAVSDYEAKFWPIN